VTACPVPAEPGELNDEQDALATALTGFCQNRTAPPASVDDFVAGWWAPLGALGVLALATPDGGGGAAEMAVTGAVLGRFGYPGPWLATVVAGQVLHDDRRQPVLDGLALSALGPGAAVPWAAEAVAHFEIDGDEVWHGEPAASLVPVTSIGGSPAAAWALRRTVACSSAARVLALVDVAAAAYLTGAGTQLLEGAAAYAQDRQQFGKSIGDFQAVAFPLADVHAHLAAAADLTWAAALSVDDGSPGARVLAAAARLSARRAALACVYACHQVYGAMGYTEEGPMAPLRRRIAETALAPPGPEALERTVLSGWRDSAQAGVDTPMPPRVRAP
jgi:alkylation response protein AidB-like acyl-CoA dehydrogenase